MRNRKLQIVDREEVNTLLAESEWGVLGMASMGEPMMIPLNFVHIDSVVYFHGAMAGEKYEASKSDPRAKFLVVGAYSQLPSYFFDSEFACPATQMYKSVLLTGQLRMVECKHEKASALEALMHKLQPQGGYIPISCEDPEYMKRLRGVAVIALDVESFSAKFKLGQDKTDSWRKNIEGRLESRGCPIDLSTIDEMRRLKKNSC